MTNIKHNILKIKNKKLKGNISLLIILILLASSVIALLAINQIQNLMTYGNMTFNYFRAHYIGKAGLELALTEVYNREDGFSTSVSSGDSINQNFVGWFNGFSNELGEGENLTGFSGFEPYFTMTTSGSFKYLTNDIANSDSCSDDNKIVLGTGEGIVIALFTDTTNGNVNELINTESGTYKSLIDNEIQNLKMESAGGETEYTFGFFSFDENWNNTDILVRTGTNLSSFINNISLPTNSTNKSYLTIRNSGTEAGYFCIGGPDLIPSSNSLITIQAHYGDMEIGLQSKVIKKTPFWALNSLGTEELE